MTTHQLARALLAHVERQERVANRRREHLYTRLFWAAVWIFWFGLLLSIASCSDDARPFGVDGAVEVSGGGAGAQGTGGAGGKAGAPDSGTPDAMPCAGCWSGGTCVPRASQTENLCGVDGQPCGRTRLDCGDQVGSCPAGQTAAARHACDEPVGQTITRTVCCPANVCTYEACQ